MCEVTACGCAYSMYCTSGYYIHVRFGACIACMCICELTLNVRMYRQKSTFWYFATCAHVAVHVSWNMPLLFSLFSLKGTSTYVTLSPYQCRDATTFAMTCCTYKSDAHVWIVNEEEKAFYLGAANTIQNFNTTTSGLNCMAYRRWVNVTNQVIESEIVCKITGGFSNPLIDNFVCKSSNDNTEYCSTELKTNICYNNVVHSILSTVQENQTSVESSQVKAIVIPIAGNCLSMCMCTHIREISCFSRNPCWEGLKEPCMSRKPT